MVSDDRGDLFPSCSSLSFALSLVDAKEFVCVCFGGGVGGEGPEDAYTACSSVSSSPHPLSVYFAISLRLLLYRFGPGPHKVELEVEYPHSPESPSDPDPATWRKWTSYLLMEMAPLDLMPHTVNLFLKQVHRQLWDGTYVTVNARHLMQIGPRYEEYPANVTDLQRSYHNFHAEGLDKVSYQEYSAKYPHEQYTIGMAGRPSGPEFYINKMNNSDMHGPGGQMNDGGMHNEADPCFGRLVKGSGSFVEILALIDRVPLNSDQYPEAKVRIKSAAILLFEEGRGLVKLEPGKKWDEKDKIMPLPEIPHGV
jgi:hypothetical protein